jgi:CubicO group peptidase (beta-lactamase class C family)
MPADRSNTSAPSRGWLSAPTLDSPTGTSRLIREILSRWNAAVARALILSAALGVLFAACDQQPKTIVMDDFESGELTDWKVVNGGSGGWFIYTNGKKAPDPAQSDRRIPFDLPDPPQGQFAAVTDMNGPGTRILYRDVKLDGRFMLHLTVYYAGAGGFSSPKTLAHHMPEPNQQFRIDLVRRSAPIDSVTQGDVLVNVFDTSPGDPDRREPTTVSVDVSPWAGQTVRLRLAGSDNRGPLRVGVDDIRFERIGSEGDARIELSVTQDPARALNPVLLQRLALRAVGGREAWARRQPSFRLLSSWLDAFNRGDRERYEQFLEDHFPSRVTFLDQEMDFRALTGGFDLRKLEQASATEVTGLVQERGSDQFASFELRLAVELNASGKVEATEPHEIASLALLGIPRPAEFPIARLTADEAIAGVKTLLRKNAAADRFGGAALIAKDGQVLFSHAYGSADREKGVANTLQTRFRIGSMNKMFTAVAILQLVEAGKVELEAPLGDYLTDYPNKEIATKVTVHQLLTHTGGTGDIFGPDFDAHRNKLRTHADYVELYGKRGPEFEPGSRWAYSNYGMVLLGAVIEKVTGQSYYDYVQAHIYEPAGMTGTGSLPEDRTVPRRSVGYMKPPGTTSWVPNTDTLPYRGTSAGGGYSTVDDLARFAHALLSHKLLSPESTELLIAGKVESAPGARYAYGFEDGRDADGNGSVGHSGGAPGMNGDLRIYPKSGYVVAVLANIDPPAAQRISEYLGPRLER